MIERAADKRGGIDTGRCGQCRGHEFAEITEEWIYHRSAEQGNGHLGDCG